MDLKKTGQFLAQLRREKNMTQEQLGVQLGISGKTISRWENGNYLPPVEMLQDMANFYGVSINEILSAQRLEKEEYREKAEVNIAAVMQEGSFGRRERFLAAGEWLRKYWWMVTVFLIPGLFAFMLLPFTVSETVSVAVSAGALMILGLILACNHILLYINSRAFDKTGKRSEFRTLRILRSVWLVILCVMAFVSCEMLLSTLHAFTPSGTSDGYLVTSIFYDFLIADGGIYPDQCYLALRRALWQTFSAVVINVDLTILWMKNKGLSH